MMLITPGVDVHARRSFYEIHQASESPIAAAALRRIAELYKVEERMCGQSAQVRKRVRAGAFTPIMD